MYTTFKAVLLSLLGMSLALATQVSCADVTSPGIGEKPARGDTSVTGTVTYRERIALTPDSTVQVQLRDTSYQDAASILIAEQVIENPGQVPVKFKIDYNRDDLDSRNTYSISARITGPDGRLLFINDTAYDVITRGNPEKVDMLLVMVSAPPFEEVPVAVVGAHMLPRESENLLMVRFLQSTIEGCSRPGNEGFDVEGSEIRVSVTRMAPPPRSEGIPCHEDLVELETVVRLRDNVVPGQTYRVTVNGQVTTAFTLPEPDFPFSIIEASPIERVEVEILESYPVQYALRVTSGLPKGSTCSVFNGYGVTRPDSTTIEVAVTHHEVAEPGVDCTDDDPIVVTAIPLGSDFEPGVEYAVTVNSETTETFVAQ